MGTTEVELLDDAIAGTESEILGSVMDHAPPSRGDLDHSPEAISEGAELSIAQNEPAEASHRDAKARGAEGAEARVDQPAPHHRVPVAELQSERQKRQAAEAERDAAQVQLSELARRLDVIDQQRRSAAQQASTQPQDLLADPNRFVSELMGGLNQKLSEVKLETSLQIAAANHRDTFSKAYEAMLSAGHSGDRGTVHRILAATNPGEALVRWYRERETLREIGTDPQAWFEQKLEARLNDPQFLAQAMQRARGQAMGGAGGRPNTMTRMPPSLNRATGSGSQTADPNLFDGSEHATFSYAFGR
ncbi:MAG TPA: hypothetical protein VHN11_17085 [Xanthobacteraceae bacterium]|jgi:hypothetical protein|nr:hypothetical protein [Xanthobacteraceae bacterium]